MSKIECPSCGLPWDTDKNNACSCGAIVRKTDVSDTNVGDMPLKALRWVKASERLPADAETKAARSSYPHPYDYSSITVEGDKLFIGVETMWEIKDVPASVFEYWEWLEEINPTEIPSLPEGPLLAQLLKFCKDLKDFWNVRSIPLRHEEDELNARLLDLLRSTKAEALPVEEVPADVAEWINESANDKYYCGGDLPDSYIYEAAAANEAYRNGCEDMYMRNQEELVRLRQQVANMQDSMRISSDLVKKLSTEILELAQDRDSCKVLSCKRESSLRWIIQRCRHIKDNPNVATILKIAEESLR